MRLRPQQKFKGTGATKQKRNTRTGVRVLLMQREKV